MTPEAYEASWMADLGRLVEVAAGAEARTVPTCPGWTVADLVDHVACVYEHKTLLLEVGKFPSRVETSAFQDRRRGNPDRLWTSAQELADALRGLDPASTAATFMADDQTVGFWWRRMALETAVHRTDAELAVGARTPVADALAVDGIDELLWFATAPWANHAPRDAWAGQRITVDAGAGQWTITLDPLGPSVVAGGGASSVVRGNPDALLQWAAGRTAAGVTVAGDEVALELLVAQLAGF